MGTRSRATGTRLRFLVAPWLRHMVSSEWGTPDMFEDGLIPEKILGSEYGHRLHFWDLLKRRHLQEIDLGKEYQLNPTHYPR